MLKAGGVHCVVGTPGRVYDMIQRRALNNPASVRQLVVANVNEMFDRGFREEICNIFRQFPNLNRNGVGCTHAGAPSARDRDAAAAADDVATPSYAAGQLQLWWSDPEQDAGEGQGWKARVVSRARKQMVWTVLHVAQRLETTLMELTDAYALPPELWMIIFTFVKHAREQQPSPQVILTLSNGSWSTVPTEVVDFTKKFMRNPIIRTLTKKDENPIDGIKQFHINVEREEWKLDTLCDIYETIAVTRSIVFVNGRRMTDWLTDRMQGRDIKVSALYGDMTQQERDVIIQEFLAGSTRVLITKDLRPGYIDMQQVPVIINYALPSHPLYYIDRLGARAGAGLKRVAITFITADDVRALRDIETFCNTLIEEMPMNIADFI
jgi:hypothetical protein